MIWPFVRGLLSFYATMSYASNRRVTWYMSESAEAVAEELSRLLLSLEGRGDDEDVAEQYLDKFREIIDAHLPEGPVVGMEEGIAVIQAAVEKFVQARQNFSEGQACMQWLASSLATLCAQYVVDLNYQHLPVETKVKFVTTISMANELLQPFGHEDFLEVLLAAPQPWPPVFLRILKGKASDMSEADVYLSREPSLLMEYRVRSLHGHGAVDDACTLAQYCMNHPSHGDVLFFREMFLLCQWQAGKLENIKRQVQFIECTKLYFIVQHFVAEEMLELAATVSTSYLIHQWKKGEYCCNKELVRQWCHIQHAVEDPSTTILESARTLAFKNDPKVLHLLYFAEALHKEVGKDSMPLVADLLLRAVDMDKPVTDPFFHPNATDDKTAYHHSAPTILSYMAVLLEGDYEIRCASQLTSFSISPDLDQYYVVEAVVNLPEEVQGTGVNLSRHKRRDILKTLRKLRPRSCGLHPEMSWQQLKPHMLKLLTSDERNKLLQEHVEAECDTSAFEEIGKSPCKVTASRLRLTEKEPVCNVVESDEDDLTVLLSDSDEESCGPISPIYNGARYGLDFATPPRPPRASSIVDNVAKDSPFVVTEEVIVCEDGGSSPSYRAKWKQSECMEEPSVSQEGWLESDANGATGTVSMDKMVDTDELMERIIKDQEEEVASSRNSSVLNNGFDADRHQEWASLQVENSNEHPAGQGVRKLRKSFKHVTLQDLLWRTNPEDFDFTTNADEVTVDVVSVLPADGGCGEWRQPVVKEEQSMNLECTETLDLDGSVQSVPSDVVRLDRMGKMHPKEEATLRGWEGFAPLEPLKNYTHSSNQNVEIVSRQSPEKGNQQGGFLDFTLSGDMVAENSSADLLKAKMANLVDQGGSCGSVFLVDLENCSAPDNTVAAAELTMAAQHGPQKPTDASAESRGATNGSNRNRITSRKNIFEAIGTVTNAAERPDRGSFLSPSSKSEIEVSKAKRRPSKQQALQKDPDIPNRSRNLPRLQDPDFMQALAPVHSLDPMSKNSWNSSASSLSSRGDTTSSHEGYDGSSEYSTETGEGMGSGPIQRPSKQEMMQRVRTFWTGFDFGQNDVTQGMDGMDDLISRTKKKAMQEPAELNNSSLGSRDKSNAPTPKLLQFNKLRQMLSERQTGQVTYTDQSGTTRLSEERTDKGSGTGNSPLKDRSERTIGVNTDDTHNTDLAYMMRTGDNFYSSSLSDSGSRISQATKDGAFGERAKGLQENIMREELLRIPQPLLSTKKRRKDMIGVGPMSIQKCESYKCGCCTFQTKYLANIKRHMIKHGDHTMRYTKDISFVCQYCEYSRSTRKEVVAHMTSTHQHDSKNSSLEPWTTDLPFRHAAAATFATKEDFFVGKEQISYDHPFLASSMEVFVPMPDLNDAKVNGTKSKIGTKKRKGKRPQNLAEIRKKTCAELAAKGIPHLQDTNSLRDSGVREEDSEGRTEERHWQGDNPSLMMPIPSISDGAASTDEVLTLRPTKQLPQTSFANFASPSEEHLTLLLQPSRDSMLAVPRKMPEGSDPKLHGSASAISNEMPIFSHHSFSPPVRMSPMVSPPVMFIASPPTPLSPTANTSPPKKSSHVSSPRSKDENQNFATVKPASKRADKKDYKATFLYNLLTDKDEMKNVAMSQGTDPSNESRYSESQSVVPPLFQQGTEVPMIQTMSPASLLPQTAFAANIPNSYNFATTFSPCQTGLQPTIGCYNVGSLPLVGSPPVYGRDEGLFVPADKKKRSRKGKSSNSRKQGTSIANAGTSPTFLKIPQKAQYSPLSHVPDSHTSIPTFRPSPSQNKPGYRRWTHDQHSPYRSGLPDLTPYGDHGETLWQSPAYWWHSPQPGQNPAHARSKPPQTPRSAAWPKSHTVTTNEVQPLDLRTTPTIRSSPSANHYVGADNSTYGPPFGKSQRQPVENDGKVSSPMKIDQVSVSLHAQSEGCPPPTEDVQVQDSQEEGQSPATKPLTVPYIPIPEHYTVSKDITVKGGSRSTVTKGSGSYHDQTEEPTSMAATPGKARETSSAGSVEQNETTGMTSGNAVDVKKVDSVDRQESSNLTLQMTASPNETKGIVSATCNNAGNEVMDGDSGALESHQYSKATGHIDGGPEDDTKEENVGGLNTGKAPFDTEPAHIPSYSESESSGSVATDKVLESNDKLFLYTDNFSDDDIPVADATITANSCLTAKESVDADKAASEVETTQTPLTDNNPSVDDVIPSCEAQPTESYISNEESVLVEDRKSSAGIVTVHRLLTTEDSSVDHAVVETDQTCKSESDHTSKAEALQTCKAEPEQTHNVEPVKTCKIEPDHACNGEPLHTCKIEVEQAYDGELLQSCMAEPEHTCNVEPVPSCKTEPEHTNNIEPVLPCMAELEDTCSSLDIQDDTVSTIDQPVDDSSTDCKDAAIGNIQAVDVLKGKSSTSSESDSLCSASLPQGKSPATGKLTGSEPGPTTVDDKPSFPYAGHEQADGNRSGYRGPMTRKRMSTDAMQSRNNSAEQRKKLKVSQDETKVSVDAKGDKNKSQIPSKVSATQHEEEELSLPSLQSPERKKPMKGLVTSTQEKLGRTEKAHKRLQKRMSAGRKKGASPVSNKTTETVAISVDTLTFPSEEGLTSQQRQESVPGKQSVGISPCVKGSKDTEGAELLERDVSNDPCLTPQKKEKTYKRSPKRSSVGKTQVADVPLPPSKQELSAVELVTEEAASLQKLGSSSPSKTNSEPFESKGDLQSLAVFSHNNLVPNENAKRSQKRGRSTGRRGRADVQRSYPKETTTALTNKQPGSNASEEDSSTSVDRKDEDSKGKISSLLGNCVRNSTGLKSKTKPLLPCTDEDTTSEPSKSKGSSQKSRSTKQGRKEKAVKSQQKGSHVDEKKLDYFLMPSSEEKPNPGSAYEFANETSEDDALTQDKSLGRGDHKEKVPPVQGRTVRRRVKSQRVRQNISSSAEEDTGSEVARSDQSVSKPTTHVKSEMTQQTVKRQQKRSAGRRKVTDSKVSSLETISTTVHDSKDSQEPTSPEPVSVSACCDEFSNLTDSTGAGTAALASSPGTDTSSSNTSSTLEGKKSQIKNRSNYLVIQKGGKAAEAPRRSDRKRVPTCKILGKTVVVYTKRKSDTSEGSSREESDHDSLLSFNPPNTGWTYSREDKKRYQKKSAVTEESEEKATETIDPTSSESAELETPILKEENMNPVGDNIPMKGVLHTSPSKIRVAQKDTTRRRLRSRSPTNVSVTIATGETKANMVDPSLMEEVPVGPSSLTSKKTMATRRRRNRSDEDDTSKVLLPEESSPPVAGGTKRKTSNKDPTSPPVDSRKVAGTVVNSASGQATVKSSISKQHCVSIPASGEKSRNNQTSGNKKSEKKPAPSSATRSTGVKTKVVRKGKQDAASGRKKSAGAGTGVPTRLLVTKGKVSPKGSRPKKK